MIDKKGLTVKVISHYNLDQYHEDIKEFWTEDVIVEDIQFSTCIDEDGDIHFTSQFLYVLN